MIQCLYFGMTASSKTSVHLNHRRCYFGHVTWDVGVCTATRGGGEFLLPPSDSYRTPLELVIRQSESELRTVYLSLLHSPAVQLLQPCQQSHTHAHTRTRTHTHNTCIFDSIRLRCLQLCVVCRSFATRRTRTFASRTMT